MIEIENRIINIDDINYVDYDNNMLILKNNEKIKIKEIDEVVKKIAAQIV